MEKLLTFSYPAIIGVLFWCWLASAVLNFRTFVKSFKQISPQILFGLFLILTLSLCLRLFYVPKIPQIFNDELNFLEIAKNMALEQRAFVLTSLGVEKFLPAPLGWEYLISLAFRCFPIKPETAFYLNSIISGLTVLPLFFLALFLAKDELTALWASLIYSILPVALRISGSAALEPSTLFFWLLAFWSLILLQKNPGLLNSLFSLFTILYLINLRQESLFFFLPILLLFWLIYGGGNINLKSPLNLLFLGFFLYFSLPYLMVVFYGLSNGFYYFYEPAKERLIHIKQNFLYNLIFWFDNRINPAVITMLASIGLVSQRSNKKLLWFLSAWLVGGYCFYSLNPSVDFSLKHTLDSWRMSLYLCPPLIILAALGIKWLRDKLGIWSVIIILLILLSFPISYRNFIFAKSHLMKTYSFMAEIGKLIPEKALIYVMSDQVLWGESLVYMGRWAMMRQLVIPKPANEFGIQKWPARYILTFKELTDKQKFQRIAEGEILSNGMKPFMYRILR